MKKITKALVLAICVALAVCAFAVVSSAEVPAGMTIEVTVDGNTTYYNNFDNAWAAATAGEGAAIVKLVGDASFYGRNEVDDGVNAEDITLDLNGNTLNVYAHNSSDEAFRVRTHGSKFKICDTSENGGGKIITGKRFLTIGDYAFRGACAYHEVTASNYAADKKFNPTNDNHADIDIDNVTITCNGANSGDGRAVIWAFILCADIDITNSTINAPDVGLIYIENNMTVENHALYIDVANTKINVNTFVVEMLQGDGTAATNLYLQENMTWRFSNCNITSNGAGNGYAFFYDVAWAPSMYNFVPSYSYISGSPTNDGRKKSGEVLPSRGAPYIYLNNCTLDTKGDGLVGVQNGADNPVNVYISGGSYKIDTDAEGAVTGENFVRRASTSMYARKVFVSTYIDGKNYINPEFNFNPANVTSSVFAGIYAGTIKKTDKNSTWKFTVDRDNLSTFSVAETGGMYKLVARTLEANILYNLSLSDVLSLNIAVPSSIVKQVRNANAGGNVSLAPTIGSTSSMAFTNTDDVAYKVFQMKNINIVSLTEVQTFIVVHKTSLAEQIVQISVLDYIKAVLLGDYNATEKELARSVLAYAIEAEKVAAEVDTEAVAELTAVLNASGLTAPEAVTEFADAKLDADLADTVLYGAAIDFSGDAPALVLALDEALAEDYVITVSYIGNRKAVNTKDYTFAAGETQVTLSGISAFDFGNDLTITIDETDYVFNLAALLNGLIKVDAKYTGFANALYNYVNAAKAYQAVAPQY